MLDTKEVDGDGNSLNKTHKFVSAIQNKSQ